MGQPRSNVVNDGTREGKPGLFMEGVHKLKPNPQPCRGTK